MLLVLRPRDSELIISPAFLSLQVTHVRSMGLLSLHKSVSHFLVLNLFVYIYIHTLSIYLLHIHIYVFIYLQYLYHIGAHSHIYEPSGFVSLENANAKGFTSDSKNDASAAISKYTFRASYKAPLTRRHGASCSCSYKLLTPNALFIQFTGGTSIQHWEDYVHSHPVSSQVKTGKKKIHVIGRIKWPNWHKAFSMPPVT